MTTMGSKSAAARGIAGALQGVGRLSRAVVPALVCLALLAGVATKAYAQTLPTVSFASSKHSTAESWGTRYVPLSLIPAPTSDITFKYTVSGTATAGSDFTIANSGTVTVSAGKAIAHILVKLIADSVREGDETVVLKLAAGEGYRVGRRDTHSATILDDETPDAHFAVTSRFGQFALSSQSAGEGSGTHDVEVRLRNLSRAGYRDVTVAYTVGGTATAGSDFTIANSGTVTVPKGKWTATIPVTIIDDSVREGDETVVLKLAAGEGYRVRFWSTHTLTILEDDVPRASFASAAQSVGEGSGTHNVEVRLDKAPATNITLAYTVGGTATAGSDFTIASSGTVTVPAGAKTATIPVTIIDDSAQEGSETVVLKLAAGGSSVVGSPGTYTLTIAANDPPAMVSFSGVGIAGTGVVGHARCEADAGPGSGRRHHGHLQGERHGDAG